MIIPDSDLYFSHIPDPGAKKAPDPGFGSATLDSVQTFFERDHIFQKKNLYKFTGKKPASATMISTVLRLLNVIFKD
jgi:hypothetical protein